MSKEGSKEGLKEYFESFLSKKSMFSDKKALQANFIPETIPFRDDQIKQIAETLAPCLRLEKASNLFVYGKTGTGKTLTVKYTTEKIKTLAEERDLPIRVIYVNCKLKKIADTEYRLVAQLAREFGKAIPITGLPTDEVYRIFYEVLDKEKKVVILVLDEIDQLVKRTGDEILYNLTRINAELKKSQISLIGISNDLMFTDNLDPRVKSSLSEEEILFPPYNAIQLQDILKQRASLSFMQGAVSEGVVEKCAAYSARENGDARRAIELLRVAAEIAERNAQNKVGIEHIDLAEEKIEKDRIVDIVGTQPKQFQTTLYSIMLITKSGDEAIFTGEIYDVYKQVCSQTGLRPLTQRRVSDILAELDMLGIINARVISKGRYGRTKEISLATSSGINTKIKGLLEEGLELA